MIAPPVRVGHQAFNIEFNKSGSRALIGNLCRQTYILSLDSLQKGIPFDPEDLYLLAEVASSSHIEDGTLHTIDTEEWLPLYNKLNRIHPEALDPSILHGLQKRGLTKSSAIARQ